MTEVTKDAPGTGLIVVCAEYLRIDFLARHGAHSAESELDFDAHRAVLLNLIGRLEPANPEEAAAKAEITRRARN
jgi:hypothetical protein